MIILLPIFPPFEFCRYGRTLHSPRPSYAPGEFFKKCPLHRTIASGEIKKVKVKYLSVSAIRVISFLLAMIAFLSTRTSLGLSYQSETYEAFPVTQQLMRPFLSPITL